MTEAPHSNVFAPATPEARAIADAFTVSLLVCAVIFVAVAAVVVVALIRNRAKTTEEDAPQDHGGLKLEVGLTALSLVICVGLFILSWTTASVSDPVPSTPEPDVIARGHQWWWEFEYPKEGFRSAYELHLPIGKRSLIRVESADVIHDFWVPELTRKIDAIPGYTDHYVWITAETPGHYQGTCAEYCGVQHAWMRFEVVLESPEDYATWTAHQAEPAAEPTTPEQVTGFKLFGEQTCGNCHAISGTPFASARIGPDLTHVSSRLALGSGLIPGNPYTVMAWVAGTQSIKPGCHMPTFKLTNLELSLISAYLGNLQ